MRVAVDDQAELSFSADGRVASAMASPMAEMRMGSDFEPDVQMAHRVVDGARERRGRAQIARLARALLAEHRVRRGRHVMHDLHLRHLVRGGQQIVHEALRHKLAFAVEGEFLQQRRADAVGDAAERHAAHDVGIDDRAAVVADDVAADLGLADLRVDRHQHDVELEGVAGIHLHAAVGVSAACRPVGTCMMCSKAMPGDMPGGSRWKWRCASVTRSIHSMRAAGRGVLHAAVAIAQGARRQRPADARQSRSACRAPGWPRGGRRRPA